MKETAPEERRGGSKPDFNVCVSRKGSDYKTYYNLIGAAWHVANDGISINPQAFRWTARSYCSPRKATQNKVRRPLLRAPFSFSSSSFHVSQRAASPSRQIPELEGLVAASGQRGTAIWGECDRCDRIRMSREGAELLAGRHFPQLECLVTAVGQRGAAIGRESDSYYDRVRELRESAKHFAGRHLPQLERLVLAAGQRG